MSQTLQYVQYRKWRRIETSSLVCRGSEWHTFWTHFNDLLCCKLWQSIVSKYTPTLWSAAQPFLLITSFCQTRWPLTPLTLYMVINTTCCFVYVICTKTHCILYMYSIVTCKEASLPQFGPSYSKTILYNYNKTHIHCESKKTVPLLFLL